MSLTLEKANALIHAAVAKARTDFNKPICVAVCDGAGFLVAFAKTDGAPFRSIAISQGKAYTAVRMGVNTDAILERLHREQIAIGYFCDDKLTPLPGGAVLKDASGAVIGGCGISGLTSAEDQIIANHLASLVTS